MIKNLKDIYPDYFQKSRSFLYPILGLKRGSNTPIDTYISWEDVVQPDDMKLVCLFHLRSDAEFTSFEEHRLLGNQYYCDYKEVSDNRAAYIFDLRDFEEDWRYFLEGSYSKLSETVKKAIRDYYGVNTTNYAFLHSYLYPDSYYDQYASFLCNRKADEASLKTLLKSVGELCDKPNFNKEVLKMSMASLNFTDI